MIYLSMMAANFFDTAQDYQVTNTGCSNHINGRFRDFMTPSTIIFDRFDWLSLHKPLNAH